MTIASALKDRKSHSSGLSGDGGHEDKRGCLDFGLQLRSQMALATAA